MKSPAVRSLETAPSWSRTVSHAPVAHLAELFAADDLRSESFSVSAGDLLIDFSRQNVNSEIVGGLVEAARECGVGEALDEMLSGAPINTTERRAVGHMALRMRAGESFLVEGVDIVSVVHETLARLSAFADAVRNGTVTGATGRTFTAVVNIGIGGSDLGPRLVHEALRGVGSDGIDNRFVANVDPIDIETQLDGLDPARTLIIVSSKTFTTVETLTNARVAVDWIRVHLGDGAVSQHVVAVSADERAVRSSGLDVGIVFPLWEWVGGRFSIGSAVGLSAMIAVGPATFHDFLAGMRDLDEHVRMAALSENAPLLMALIGIWNHAVLGRSTRAIVPYSNALRLLPGYLQQLIMESNGKSVRIDGSPVGLPTAAVIWGDVGTNAQHAFMQQIHQGTTVVPVDFIGFARSSTAQDVAGVRAQRTLFMNLVAQAEALAFGRSHAQAHRSFEGNRPSTVIVAEELTARVLGQILALYEHAVFYEGKLLGINSFDQWGVELGKNLASDLLGSTHGSNESANESRASRHLVEWFEASTAGERA